MAVPALVNLVFHHKNSQGLLDIQGKTKIMEGKIKTKYGENGNDSVNRTVGGGGSEFLSTYYAPGTFQEFCMY